MGTAEPMFLEPILRNFLAESRKVYNSFLCLGKDRYTFLVEQVLSGTDKDDVDIILRQYALEGQWQLFLIGADNRICYFSDCPPHGIPADWVKTEEEDGRLLVTYVELPTFLIEKINAAVEHLKGLQDAI